MIDVMLAAAREAATAIMDVYLSDHGTTTKADGSPVTLADTRAEAIILRHLAPTGIPVISEESFDGQPTPPEFFCVDPLDGTKEFVKRNGEFTVNIALIRAGRPVLGVVLAPATGATYTGGPDGAFEVTARDERLALRARPDGPLRVVASRSHGHDALETFCDAIGVVEDVSIGSSLKFCLLARGDAQIYPRFTPTNEWDTAAGQAVLEAAGGAVLTLDGAPLGYGKNALNPFFIAAASSELAARGAVEMGRSLGRKVPNLGVISPDERPTDGRQAPNADG